MNYWWCNQSRDWKQERAAEVVCASDQVSSVTYRANIMDVRAGDLVVHYRKPNIVAISRAMEDGRHHDPLPLVSGVSYGSGWRFRTEYYDLPTPLRKEGLVAELMSLSKKNYAVNPDGGVKQGYFLSFDEPGFAVVLNHLRQPLPNFLTDGISGFSASGTERATRAYPEGSAARAIVNRYRRDPRAREECLRHHKPECYCCPVDLHAIYGEQWRRLIEVHHIIELSKLGADYQTDPVTDLRPVCPSCHAYLHLQRPPFHPDDLRERLRVPKMILG